MTAPPIVPTVAELRTFVEQVRRAGRPIGFVPTMGALHAGHLSLVQRAAEGGAHVVVSIFVNPTQFGPNEDFARYPRSLPEDQAALQRTGVDVVVFAPSVEEMYPRGERTRVRVEGAEDVLCGPFRPGHFEGVATVVAKLFAIVGPCRAYFGRKDYQQLQVIRRMAADLQLPVDVHGAAIVREADGLAMSSRNRYLSADERQRALSIARALAATHAAFTAGERDVARLQRVLTEPLGPLDSLDYASIADADSLQPLQGQVGERALVAIAGRLGSTRLIDNLVLGEDPAPGGVR